MQTNKCILPQSAIVNIYCKNIDSAQVERKHKHYMITFSPLNKYMPIQTQKLPFADSNLMLKKTHITKTDRGFFLTKHRKIIFACKNVLAPNFHPLVKSENRIHQKRKQPIFSFCCAHRNVRLIHYFFQGGFHFFLSSAGFF